MNPKKVIFVTHNPENECDGVWKKIKSQVKALRALGFNVDFFYMSLSKKVMLDDGNTQKEIPSNNKNKFLFYYYVSKFLNYKYDVVYIRKPHGGLYSFFLPLLFNKILKLNANSYIYFEIPTYPYENEIKTWRDRLSEFVFKCARFFIVKKISEIIYIGESDKPIWGIRSRQMSNGIDINSHKLLKHIKGNESEFTFVGVANLAFWHGYDRLIESIYQYKGRYKIVFHIIGNGEPEYSRLVQLTSKRNISENVIFHGKLSGESLNDILSKADVCVDSLGRHRSGNNVNNSIKSKEYCAKGCPFIKSHDDNSFSNEEFIYQISSDDSILPLDDIIKWRENLNCGFEEREREFAINKLTWEKQFSFILNDRSYNKQAK